MKSSSWAIKQCSGCGKFVGQSLLPLESPSASLLSCEHEDEHSSVAHFDDKRGTWLAELAQEVVAVPTPTIQRQRSAGRQNSSNSPQSPSKFDVTNTTAVAYVSEETLACVGIGAGNLLSFAGKVVARISTSSVIPPFHVCLSPKYLQDYLNGERLIQVKRVRVDKVIDVPSVHLIPQLNYAGPFDLAAVKGENNTDASKKETLEAVNQLAKTCLSTNYFHNNQPVFLATSNVTLTAAVRVPDVDLKFPSEDNTLKNVDNELSSRMSQIGLLQVPGTPNSKKNGSHPHEALAWNDENVYRLSREKESRIVIRDNTLLDPDIPAEAFYFLCGSVLYNQLVEVFKAQLFASHDLIKMGFRPPRGILLHGSPGTGKSSLCAFLADLADTQPIMVTADRVFTRFYGDSEAALRSLFDNAIRCAPSTIIIDDIDVFCCKGEAERKLVACLCSLLDMIHRLPASIRLFVIAATSKLDAVDAALRRYGRLDHEFELLPPDTTSRRNLFAQLLARADHLLSADDMDMLAEMTSSFVAADIRALCTEAAIRCSNKNRERLAKQQHLNDSGHHGENGNKDNIVDDEDEAEKSPHLTAADFMAVFPRVRPTARRDICVEVPRVRWQDIGGLDGVKNRLRQCVEWPLRHASALTRLGLRPPRGALLYGPPGCSKTLIARALATESGLAFLSIKGPELFNKWLGESERAVRQLFRRARQAAPSIIFFDEVDAIAPARSGGPASSGSSAAASSASERVVAQLLTELDGIQELDRVFVLAATNRPDVLDTAVIRPGRLDRLIYVPLPDIETRREILLLQLARTPVKSAHGAMLETIVEHLAEKTEGYTGAEVVSLVQEAAFHALDRSEFAAVDVKESDFDYAFTVVKPRTDHRLLASYSAFAHAH